MKLVLLFTLAASCTHMRLACSLLYTHCLIDKRYLTLWPLMGSDNILFQMLVLFPTVCQQALNTEKLNEIGSIRSPYVFIAKLVLIYISHTSAFTVIQNQVY